MNFGALAAVAGVALNVGLVLFLAPLFHGVLRKVTARIQSRRGPPLVQPYVDLLKLLGKEDIESGDAPMAQRTVAYFSLATVLSVAAMVPMGFSAPLDGVGDVFLVIGLLMVSSACTVAAGLAAGSTYSLVGMSREMMAMTLLEPLLAVAMVVGSLHSQSFRISAVLEGTKGNATPSMLIMAGVALLAFQAFVGRVPFDTTEAETELMAGPLLEYSGRKLALLEYARMAKLVVYSAIFVALFAPFGSGLPEPLSFVLFWAEVSVLVLLVTVVAATHARYRIDQSLRYLGGLFGIALVALTLAAYGH